MIEDDVCPHGKPDLFCFECYDSQPAETTLPGCMMPDGAEPCRAYRLAIARAEAAERDNARLREVVLRRGLHRNAPCCLCGHSGPGMYRPETHPCIAAADALRAQPGEEVDG